MENSFFLSNKPKTAEKIKTSQKTLWFVKKTLRCLLTFQKKKYFLECSW